MGLTDHRRALGVAGVGWAVLFAAAHGYWAVGGRLGVPSDMAEIAQRPWFLAYDVVAGLLCVLGAALLARLVGVQARGRSPAVALVRVLRLGAVLLGLRAVVGLLGDVALLAGGEAGATMLFDVWFAVGAVLFAVEAALPELPRVPLRRERGSG